MKERDYLFDNAKGILAFLVVFAHIVQHANFLSEEYVDYVNRGIYMFHMPAFIFISGYFSKKHNEKRILNLFALYFVWQMFISPMAYSILKDISFQKAFKSFFLPQATYWYLFSLIIWRVVTPYVTKLKGAFWISLVVALMMGLTTLKFDLINLSLGRTIVFYPFFLLGVLCTKERFYKIKNKIKPYWGLIAFIGVIAVGVALMYAVVPLLSRDTRALRLLTGRYKYDAYFTNPYDGVWVNAIFYFVRIGATFLFFTFIPSKKCFLTKLGEASLFIYLTHWWFISYFKENYFQNPNYENGLLVLGFGFTATVLYCWLLTTKPFMKLGHFMTNIKIDWLIKKEPTKTEEC